MAKVSAALLPLLILAVALATGCTDAFDPSKDPGPQNATAAPAPCSPCAPSAPTPAGFIHVSLATSGSELDPDGYSVIVDERTVWPAGINGAINVVVSSGEHTLRLDGIATNCVTDSARIRPVKVLPELTSEEKFTVSCLGHSSPAALAGTQLLFVRGARIYRTTLGDTTSLALAIGHEPSWSPDGRRVAFVRDSDVYVMDADGANARMVAAGADGYPVESVSTSDGQTAGLAPAWSPDGRRLAFAFASGLAVVSVDGSAPPTRVPVGDRGNFYGSPTWSPDGRRITFVSDFERIWDEDAFHFYVVDADGSNLKMVNADPGSWFKVWYAWSPDGSTIASIQCAQDACADTRLVTMNADGSNLRTLARTTGFSKPAWSPDGKVIAFVRTCTNYKCPTAVLYVNADGSQTGVMLDNAHSPAWH